MQRPQQPAYELTDHVCRACFGRILRGRRPEGHGDDRAHTWLCSNCGASSVHREVDSVCACGMRLRHSGDLGLRCIRAVAPTPEFPSQVVATQLSPAEAAAPKPEPVTAKAAAPKPKPPKPRAVLPQLALSLSAFG